MLLEKDHDRIARWDKENNRWNIRDQPLYRWTDMKQKPVSNWYHDISGALNFIIEYDIQSHQKT
jgi:hypothetical protein